MWFEDPRIARGLRAYCAFADIHLAHISALNSAAYQSVPSFAPVLAGLSGEAMLAQNRVNLAKIAAGAHDGNWEPYLESLRERGDAYARAGVDFRAWSEAFARLVSALVDFAFEKVQDREELRVLVLGTAALFDLIVQVVGESFFATHTERVREQAVAIRELSTPILIAAERRLLVPLVGELDDERMRFLTARLLKRIRNERARAVVIDLTGVAVVDSAAMEHLSRITASAALMGANVILSGLSPGVCRSLVDLGVGLPAAETVATLAEALELAALATRAPGR